MSLEYRIGDVRERLAEIPDGSIDLIVTSPPFLALRSYLPADHPDKAREIGSEATPAAFLDTLLALTAEWGRVLAPHGSLCVELGDTYSGAGGYGSPDSPNPAYGAPRFDERWEGRTRKRFKKKDDGWPLAKSLTGIPTLYPWSLAYGRNLLTGQPSPAGQWRIRNVIVWARPNPPVGCVDDATEALTLDGWKPQSELRDGDMIAAYDPRTDSCRFQPATFVRWHRDGEPMVAIEKRATSQRLTEDHRAWTRTRKAPPHVRLARDLTGDCQTLLCAPFDDVPGPAPLRTGRAELLGWYIAEGSPHHRQARIVQSVSANPYKVARIRSLLEFDGADFRETTYGRGASSMVTFHIKGELAEWLNLHHKRLPMHYVTTWPEAQVRALFNGLIDGDGHRRAHRGVLFHQKDEAVADAVQVLGLRLGYRASKSWQPSLNLWQITMSDAPSKDRRWTMIRKWDGEVLPRESYTGVVWCPQVETSYWLARRNGRTFITGNSLGDKFRPATSYITVACRGVRRYFDLDAVRTEPLDTNPRTTNGSKPRDRAESFAGTTYDQRIGSNPAGAPPLDWHTDNHPEDGDWLWKLSTQPYAGSHYATFPMALPKRLIEAMCPLRVCTVCGRPSERIVEVSAEYRQKLTEHADLHAANRNGSDQTNPRRREFGLKAKGTGDPTNGQNTQRTTQTIGWSDCGCWCPTCDGNGDVIVGREYDGIYSPCPDCHGGRPWRTGVVLDPFAGSGTTLEAAQAVGRHAIGIDLDPRNADLARSRVGMFLDVDEGAA